MADVCNQSDRIIKNQLSEMKGMQEKESIMGVMDRQKFRPSESQSDITRQASWCQTVILGTDFSIYPSHQWCYGSQLSTKKKKKKKKTI